MNPPNNQADIDTADIVEVDDDEFPHYFSERNGRLYHSNPSSPYPLPVDANEQERQTALHNCLRELMGANYIGPVAQVLAPQQGRQKLVVDFGTGKGTWVLEMAREFPHVLFAGLDIVPIATRYPPPNVQFELHDINERTRFPDRSVDFVHARDISMTTCNYSAVLQEITRILRPGGIFLSGEWIRQPSYHPDFHVQPAIPFTQLHLSQFYDILNDALQSRGISSLISVNRHAALIGPGLAPPTYGNNTSRQYHLPLCPWPAEEFQRRLGGTNREATARYMEALKPLLLARLISLSSPAEAGLKQAELNNLYRHIRGQLTTVQGLATVYSVIWSRRL